MKKVFIITGLMLLLMMFMVGCDAEEPGVTDDGGEEVTDEEVTDEATDDDAAVAGDVVRITNGEWPPWLSENLKHYGLASHIVSEAFAREGIEVEYGFFPWARAYDVAKEGEWHGSVVWSIDAEREQDFLYTDTVLYGETVFWYIDGNDFDWDTPADLQGLMIGRTLEYAYQGMDEYIDEYGLTTEEAPSDEMNLEKLFNDRLDVFPLDREIALELIWEHYSPEDQEKFKFHPKPINQKSYHLILTKALPENEDYLAKFNSGLQKLIDSGDYDQFIQDSLDGKYKLD